MSPTDPLNSASPPIHPSCLPIDELLRQCRTKRTRRSGPGGQHRNKVETAVVLIHRPSHVKAEASERRSQKENRDVAIGRLRVNLALSVRLPRSVEDSVSELWRSRCAGRQLNIATAHEHFPNMLAEAMDFLTALDFHVPNAARHLGVSMSQLVKFLKQEPRAFDLLNQQRVKLGLRALK